MIFTLLTLLAALALAAVAGWFSIIGIMAIYAGAPLQALIMGIVAEGAKLVTTSWLYRNWSFSNWKLKIPLIVFTVILMLVTSIGVFGFLSKAHLEQTAGTINNSAQIERLDQQIAREKTIIADAEKVIEQLDKTVNSFLDKDRTDRSLAVRRSQDPQRRQLRQTIAEAQKKVDQYSDERLKLQSEIRNLELEVGPIRYIADLIYGKEGNQGEKVEGAVKIFTLLIVLTLDPLAVVLLIAANQSLLRYQNEKQKNKEMEDEEGYSRSTLPETSQGERTHNQLNEVVSSRGYYEETSDNDSLTGGQPGIPSKIQEVPLERINEEKKEQNLQETEGFLWSKDLSKGIEPKDNEGGSSESAVAEAIQNEISINEKTQTQKMDDRGHRENVDDTYDNDKTPEVQNVDNQEASSNSLEQKDKETIPNKVFEEADFDINVEEILKGLPKVYRPPIIHSPSPTQVDKPKIPWAFNEEDLRTNLGTHFVPQKVVEQNDHKNTEISAKEHKYPKALSWLKEFDRGNDGPR